MIHFYRMTWILAGVLASSGCETIVEVNLPEHTPTLVANSFFNPDSVWSVRLFKSKSSLDNGPIKIITNATVSIEGERGLVATLTHVRDGLYRARPNQMPQLGEVYTLLASAPGFEPIKASDYVPEPVPVESVDADISSSPIKLTIHFADPPHKKNYYQILLLSPDAIDSDRLIPVWFDTDDLVFQKLNGVNPFEALFDDSLISGQNYRMTLRAYPFNLYDPVRKIYVVLLSVTESYFKYMKSTRSQQENGDNPFSTPVQIYNNIENGLGIFAGYSVSIFPVFWL